MVAIKTNHRNQPNGSESEKKNIHLKNNTIENNNRQKNNANCFVSVCVLGFCRQQFGIRSKISIVSILRMRQSNIRIYNQSEVCARNNSRKMKMISEIKLNFGINFTRFHTNWVKHHMQLHLINKMCVMCNCSWRISQAEIQIVGRIFHIIYIFIISLL